FDLCDRYGKAPWDASKVAYRYDDPETGMPLAGLLGLLAEFGAIAGRGRKQAITPLGRWATAQLTADLPGPADPDLSASEMIAQAARFGDEALPVWESMPGANLDACLTEVRATGHPDAEQLIAEVAEFAASGAPRSIDQVAELKISLANCRPPIWRRIRLPVTVTLADLHEVIQVLFGWGGDHLHLFQAGKKLYSDPFVRLEYAGDERAVRVRDVLTPGGRIEYNYDLGAEWEHEIAMEKIVARDLDQDYPVCLAYKGDSPVEYWSEEDPEEPEPFNLPDVNRKLVALAGSTD
ncbi:MAG TPA: plasmid pRiA4b ORF-3 family protein, partial [Streptosporangiaceae bacterium]|nr:plasmid pRiA4b ORF-3 family protein [Streptosporangiaceae bacterium]